MADTRDDGVADFGELERCLGGSPTLLWRIEPRKSRIEVLGRQTRDHLAVDIIQVLKNPDLRGQHVPAADLGPLNAALAALRRGEAASAVFRLPRRDGGMAWLDLAGHVDPARPGHVWGRVSDVTAIADAVRGRLPGAGLRRRRRARPDDDRTTAPAAPEDGGIESVLAFLYDNQVGPPFEAILFSDIIQRRSHVVVYSHGQPFAGMEQGKVFTFEGTIAETILTFGLDHLVIGDTSESIKAIDWALFIPAGIRSYFAKPFFQGRTLHSVLILCSTAAHRFPEERIGEYDPLYAPFLRAVTRWRKGGRERA